jgi:hypothetical protein
MSHIISENDVSQGHTIILASSSEDHKRLSMSINPLGPLFHFIVYYRNIEINKISDIQNAIDLYNSL